MKICKPGGGASSGKERKREKKNEANPLGARGYVTDGDIKHHTHGKAGKGLLLCLLLRRRLRFTCCPFTRLLGDRIHRGGQRFSIMPFVSVSFSPSISSPANLL